MLRNLFVKRLFAKVFGRHLDLSEGRITSEYLRHLIYHTPKLFMGLSMLSLARNAIDDAVAIVQLIDLAGPSLLEIDVSGNPLIRPDGAEVDLWVLQERSPVRLRECLTHEAAEQRPGPDEHVKNGLIVGTTEQVAATGHPTVMQPTIQPGRETPAIARVTVGSGIAKLPTKIELQIERIWEHIKTNPAPEHCTTIKLLSLLRDKKVEGLDLTTNDKDLKKLLRKSGKFELGRGAAACWSIKAGAKAPKRRGDSGKPG